ncbi:conjugal transfer protein TraH [Cysteiniphilum marinum]|uniref:conjugal transfer protein TraH n=1 Tax=Cysteiniphilum marinum TaxID=2774191 RepID=UPI00193C7E00|nr:conjugal transfer protein TraH [Cysteiniphilum marinum]
MLRFNKIIAALGVVTLSLSGQLSYASLSSDMQNFLGNTGYASNITNGAAVINQQGGYVTAGSGFIRTPAKHLQLLDIQAPNVKFGCGGIDLFTGGLSFVNAQQLIKMGQSIMQNAAPFAVQLALQTWAPSIKSALDYMQKLAQDINNFNMSSCEAAQLTVGGIAGWFTNSENNKFLCQTYGSHTTAFSGWLAAKQGCSDPATSKQQTEQAKSKPELKDMVKQNRNLVWYFLMKNPFLSSNTEIAEYVMTMTGSLINETDNSGKPKFKQLEPLIKDAKSAGFDLMLNGKSKDSNGKKQDVKVYKCDDTDAEKCLKPSIQALSFAESAALVPKLRNILIGIGDKIRTNTALTASEQNIINSVNFPIFRLIETQLMAGWFPEYHEYAEIIARIILTDYINQIIGQARLALTMTDLGKDDDMKWLIKNLDNAHMIISQHVNQQAYQALKQKSDLVMRSLRLESVVVGQMSAETHDSYYYAKTN